MKIEKIISRNIKTHQDAVRKLVCMHARYVADIVVPKIIGKYIFSNEGEHYEEL